ncbi:caspase domain-containing protein [Chloroflexota bacterium]
MLTQASKWTVAAWVFVVFTLLLSINHSARAYAVADLQYWAVVVGISDYEDSNLDVDCTAHSATEIHDQLASIWGQGHTKLFLDSQATKSNIQTSIVDWLGSQADANDTVLFFFTGHGDDSEAQEYICVYDEDISDVELNEWMSEIASSAQIIVLDSCHSGGFIEELSQNNRVIMTACDAEQHACTLFSLGHSIFSFCVIQAFKNLDDTNIRNDGLVSAEEIYRYADSQVPKYVGENQRPRFYDGYPGELRMIGVPIFNAEIKPDDLPETRNFIGNIWFFIIGGVVGVIGVTLLVLVVRSRILKRKRVLS